jgi:hypothetical protein
LIGPAFPASSIIGGRSTMPGFLTDLVNNKVLDCFFGGVAITPPTTLHVGLSLTKSYRGGYISEPSGGSYARVAVPNDLAHFVAASTGSKSNASTICFPTPTAAWGSILSVFIADSADGGNVLAMADLPAARIIDEGGPSPVIAVNALFLSHN